MAESWVLEGLRSVRALAVTLLLLVSLALNMASFVGGALFTTASAAFEAVTGTRSLVSAHAAEVADLKGRLDAERRVSRDLRSRNRQLETRVRDLEGGRVTFRGKRVAVSEAVDETADRISRRARNAAIRDVGAMAGEAIPWLGIAVIVGVTSLEIKDLCDTIRDMNALKRAFDPESAPGEDETTVCSMAIPSRQELWEKVKASPDAAWQRAREVVPTLPEMTEFTIDWRERITEGIEKAIDETRQGGAAMMDRVWREAPDVAK